MNAYRNFARALAASRFLRFCVVGTGGFVIDVSTFYVFHDVFGLNAYAARVVSILVSMTFSWWGNRTLTFHEHAATGARAMLREWLKFASANAVGAVANYTIFATLLTFAPYPFNYRYFALAAGTGVGLIFNFTLSKRLVFRTSVPPAI